MTFENVLPTVVGKKRYFGGTLGYFIRNFFKLKPFFEKEYITESDQKNEIDPCFAKNHPKLRYKPTVSDIETCFE